MADKARMVWLDMEMSGLDPEKERVLEVAVIITDGQLETVAEGPNLVVHQDDAVLDAMDEWNRTHHGESGLTERVRASELSVEQAEDQLLSFIKEHCAERAAPLAGNSIHQDRRFLRRYMPRLDAYLHYRHVDVGTIKELCKRWYPDALAEAPKKKEAHRALDDIRESIDELRFYRTRIFR